MPRSTNKDVPPVGAVFKIFREVESRLDRTTMVAGMNLFPAELSHQRDFLEAYIFNSNLELIEAMLDDNLSDEKQEELGLHNLLASKNSASLLITQLALPRYIELQNAAIEDILAVGPFEIRRKDDAEPFAISKPVAGRREPMEEPVFGEFHSTHVDAGFLTIDHEPESKVRDTVPARIRPLRHRTRQAQVTITRVAF